MTRYRIAQRLARRWAGNDNTIGYLRFLSRWLGVLRPLLGYRVSTLYGQPLRYARWVLLGL